MCSISVTLLDSLLEAYCEEHSNNCSEHSCEPFTDRTLIDAVIDSVGIDSLPKTKEYLEKYIPEFTITKGA